MLGVKKVVWLILAFHYSDAFDIPLFLKLSREKTGDLTMKVIVPQTEQISSNSMEGTRLSMTENEAEIFKTLKHEDLLKNVKYKLLSFILIKGLLDDMKDSAITITWDDTFAGPMKMLFTEKTSMLKSKRHSPLVETESISKLQTCAFSYIIEYGGSNAFINEGVVFFDFQNVPISSHGRHLTN